MDHQTALDIVIGAAQRRAKSLERGEDPFAVRGELEGIDEAVDFLRDEQHQLGEPRYVLYADGSLGDA